MLGEESYECAVSVMGLVQTWLECMGDRGTRCVIVEVKTKRYGSVTNLRKISKIYVKNPKLCSHPDL